MLYFFWIRSKGFYRFFDSNLRLIFFSFVLTYSLHSNTIAVVPSEFPKEEYVLRFGRDLISILKTRKVYQLVEKEKLEEIYQELQKSQSGLVQQEEAPKLGYLKSIHYFVFYDISRNEGALFSANFRIVLTETGSIIGASREKGDYETVLEKLSQRLMNQLDIYLNIQNPEKPYTVLLQLDKPIPVYKVGEKLKIRFKVISHKQNPPRKVYIQLFSIDAKGTMSMIYPNKYSGFEPIELNKEYTFPSHDDDFEWELEPPTGTEFIQAFVSEEPKDVFGTLEVSKRELFPTSKYNGNSLMMTRGIKVQLNKEKYKNWAAMRIAYELVE
ncbi:MAG: DUF4384 domain-containing protein [Leptospiraceae bacterium]|nr:DUF4384 domain-containing protein [Leptospiraceae bacterium]MDW7976247.1 DUF4384 domain-containing protein [Leptospiraceae bacterium]